MNTHYPGFCDKYGEGEMWVLGFTTPLAINTAIQFSKSAQIENIAITGCIAAFAGMTGALWGNLSHFPSHVILTKKGMGITKGAKITKQIQAATYAVPVTLALMFNSFLYPLGQKNEEQTALKETPPITYVIPENK